MNERLMDFIFSNKFTGPIIIVCSAIIVYRLVAIILNKAVFSGKTELEKKKRRTLILLFNNIMKYIVIITALLLILDIYGINTTSLLAGIGIAGVVVGLALQDALKDIIGGINIILENYYILGDTVKYNDFMGTVIEFGLKSTKIKSQNGEVLVLSNRSIDKIINLSQKQAIINIEIPTAHECDNKKVRKVLEALVEKVKKYDYVDANGCLYTGIDRIEKTSVIYTFTIKCRQEKGQALKRELLEMVKEAYEKESLKIN